MRSIVSLWTLDTDSQFKLTYTKPAVFADDNL